MHNRTKTIAFFLLLLGALAIARAYGQERAKNVYKLFRVSPSEIGIACLNGADPTGEKHADILFISCGPQ